MIAIGILQFVYFVMSKEHQVKGVGGGGGGGGVGEYC